MLRFTGYASARLDDQFDSAATLSLGFDQSAMVEDEDFRTPEEEEFERNVLTRRQSDGRSEVTGY